MNRPGYRAAIRWIAENDSPGCDDALDADACAGLVTAVMVAHIFDVQSEKVGQDIARERAKAGE